ncbi:calcium-binding protein [Azospirillum thermophilum]|uniref:Calcium-binding protein n=1 Tax=Azospirillum thermophilum TaxID=2202148 RepID=A0A2S2CKZ7_9PROT|nr:calcium-binding protein [Azospirillum thermophilum]AWK84987.1 hypothetical protein DEW08_01250 [Azospirillum thermophilum]
MGTTIAANIDLPTFPLDSVASDRRPAGPQVARTLTGTARADTLTGGPGADRISGNDGDDLISGLGGPDRLYGDQGNDTIRAGTGNDAVYGGMGNDTLFAGDDPAPDTLVGGTGNDSFWVNGPEDLVVEAAGGGIDTVIAKYGWALGNALEHLTLQEKGSSANGDAIGNGLDNRLTGNAGNNRIDGRDGADLTLGRGGNDILWAGAGNDTMYGGTGNDLMGGGIGIDSLFGGTGNDTLYAGDDTVADTLTGGTGDDVYWINGSDSVLVPSDFILENPGEGTDTVFVKGTYGMANNIENVTVQTGTGGGLIWGNEQPNLFIGNESGNGVNSFGGDDTLLGLEGDDSLNGAAGDDLMVGGAGNDYLGPFGMDSAYSTPIGRDTMIGGKGDDGMNAGGAPSRHPWINYADEPDLILFGREEKGGFGNDRIIGFDESKDLMVFIGYSAEDLTAPVELTDLKPYIDGATSWTADFSFKDGSTVHVTGYAQGMPSLNEGSDYVFSDPVTPGAFADADPGRQVQALAASLPTRSV